jgi:hypothetical protein
MDRLEMYLEWGTRTQELDRWWVTNAINTDDITMLEALVSREMVDHSSLYGSYGTAYTSAMCLAIRLRRPAMVSLLLDVVPIDEEDLSGKTPLYTAVDTDQDNIAIALIGYGADVNFPRFEVTPFFKAVQRKNVGLAAVMIVNGADIGATSGEWTAMATAVHNNDTPMVQLLMRWVADWQEDLEFLIYLAIEINSLDMLALLTNHLNKETYNATPHIHEAVFRGSTLALDFFTPFKAIGPLHVTSVFPRIVAEWIATKKIESDMCMSLFVGEDLCRAIKSFLVPSWTIQHIGEVFIMSTLSK